jgi:sarcosine oxidase
MIDIVPGSTDNIRRARGSRCPLRSERNTGEMQTADVVVIGAGAMGSATSRALAAAGREVLVLEQYELGHRLGGSHGGTRLFRLSVEDEAEQLRAQESKRLWEELESETGVQMLDLVGGVDHGVDERQVQQFRSVFARLGIEHEVLRPEEAAERWPGLRFETEVLYQPGSGRALADQALAAIRQSAEGLGVEFRSSCPVTGLRVVGDGVEVETAAGVVRAGQVVVTAGPWTGEVVAGLVELPAIRVSQEQPRIFAPVDPGAAWPVFVHHRAGASAYGVWEAGHGVKVGLHASGPSISLSERDFLIEPGRDAELLEYVGEWYPGLDLERSEAISCLYDNTERGEFIIERHGPISVAAGFHGEGFKFVPLVAQQLTDLVTGRAGSHHRP